jgi:uracil-DNA glycosylase family 4
MSRAIPDPLTSLADHLRYLDELGIDGVSRDATWTRRPAEVAARAPVEAVPAVESPPVMASAAAGRGRREPVPRPPEEGLPPRAVPLDTAPPPAGERPDPTRLLAELRAHIGDCTRCKLHRLGRTQIVFGVGNPLARLMFVGEAPGGDEDVQGIPFVGRAGQLLTKIIEAMGLTRDDVYIANLIKCRPPDNRNPEPDEVATCEPFLFRQVDAIAPEVIVALGTFAAHALLRTKAPISRLRGQVLDYRGARLIPTFHPAYLLRYPEKKRETWEDMKRVMALLAAGRS